MASARSAVPLISVIVPVYNAERFLVGTIESILNQDYGDFELILVDDCSTDASAQLIRAYLSERVRYFREPTNRGGPSAPRNTGIRHARGKYLLMFDADDLMLPGKLRLTQEVLRRYREVGLIYTNYQSVDERGRILKDDFLADYRAFRSHLEWLDEDTYRLSASDAYRELLGANFVGTSSVAIPRHVIEDVGLFDASITNGDDFDMWLRIAARYDFLFLDRVLHSYRINAKGVSARGSRNSLNRIKVLERQLKAPLDPECSKRARRRLQANYCDLGNAERRQGDYIRARQYLRQSMHYGLTWAAVKGFLATFLPLRGTGTKKDKA